MARQTISKIDTKPMMPARKAAGSARKTAKPKRPPSSRPMTDGPGARRNPDGTSIFDARRVRGRGSRTNDTGRFEKHTRLLTDDGWSDSGLGNGDQDDLFDHALRTEVTIETPRKIISKNQSPDIHFDRSINPYRGCEHGCTYCFARPTHAYMGLSSGLDFETKLFAKPNAAELLEKELRSKSYRPRPIAIGTNTDPYQPIDDKFHLMAEILEVLSRFNHPVTILTKNARILNDLDIIADMARRNLVKVALSVTTLDKKLARSMEPRASAPHKRLEAVTALHKAGVPVGVMMAPIIPALNDSEIEAVLEAAKAAGAGAAGYVMLRLPREVRDLFIDWLKTEQPGKADRVMSHIRAMRHGKDYDARYWERFQGASPYGDLIRRRFRLAKERLGFPNHPLPLDLTRFKVPLESGDQMSLLD